MKTFTSMTDWDITEMVLEKAADDAELEYGKPGPFSRQLRRIIQKLKDGKRLEGKRT